MQVCVLHMKKMAAMSFEPSSHQSGKKVKVGKDLEKAQSEKDSHSINQGGKKNNQQSGTYTMKTYRKPNEQPVTLPMSYHAFPSQHIRKTYPCNEYPPLNPTFI